MRLRNRARSRPEEPLAPVRAALGWTTVGNLDSSARGLVDPAGLIAIAGAGWALDWWIGAEDRWHLPAREAAVRQQLVGDSPVVETRVRVPGGDAVQRVFAARSASGDDVLVVEIRNDSKVPFAVALAVRPHGLDALGGIDSCALEGLEVRVDGRVALALPRPPGRVAVGGGAEGDVLALVVAGDAIATDRAQVRCADGLANAAVIYPLAHTAALRVVLPLSPAAGPVRMAELPGPDQVASGWATHTRRAARFEVPERRLRVALTASTRHLLLGASDPPLAASLDLLGLHGEARAALLADPVSAARTDEPGALLHALGWHWALTRDAATAADAVPLVAALVGRLRSAVTSEDVELGRAALPLVADLLEAGGERRGAADVRSVSRPSVSSVAADLTALLDRASPTWTWPSRATGHDLTANALLVATVRGMLVREVVGGLALSPAVAPGWMGQGWEVHDVPTACGRLSYAVRWHGDRPALLWELDPHADSGAVRLTSPLLDPAWASEEQQGEALLAPVALPARAERRAVSIPVTIQPMPRRAT